MNRWPLVILASVIALCAMLSILSAAFARWKPEYANAPQAVQNWYESRELTKAAQKRFNFKSCCAHSDVVRTKFKAGGAGDEWWWLDGKTWRRIPDDVIHWGVHAPNGQPVMFALGSQPTCFFPPDGGI